MNLFGLMETSGSAMQAERMRAEVVAANMANAETTRTASGGVLITASTSCSRPIRARSAGTMRGAGAIFRDSFASVAGGDGSDRRHNAAGDALNNGQE